VTSELIENLVSARYRKEILKERIFYVTAISNTLK